MKCVAPELAVAGGSQPRGQPIQHSRALREQAGAQHSQSPADAEVGTVMGIESNVRYLHKMKDALALYQYQAPALGILFARAFAERREGAVEVFARGPETLSRASLLFERIESFSTAILASLHRRASIRDRRSSGVSSFRCTRRARQSSPEGLLARRRLLAATGWIHDSGHAAANFRIVDSRGAIMFDKFVADSS